MSSGLLFEAEVAETSSSEKKSFTAADISRDLNEKVLQKRLEKLGRLPEDFDERCLLDLLSHVSPDIRLLAVKNLGKLKREKLYERLRLFALAENNTLARREAVSALGRLKTPRAIPTLINFLHDQDAKIVLQAVRALLPYRKDYPKVQEGFALLEEHPNELVRDAIAQISMPKPRVEARDAKHHVSANFLKNLLVHGDVREVLPCIPDESIHLTFTSPPYYNARDYTIYNSYEEYLQLLANIFREVHRVTKEGRFFVLNTSPVIVPRMSRSHSSTRYLIPFDIHPLLTEMGWEFVEDIIWIKPDPSAKNRNGGFFQHRKPLAYKANCVTEYVIVYRKKTEKLIDWNINQYDDEIVEQSKVLEDYEKTNAWKIAPSNDPIHPATFPKELVARIIQFYSYKGDLVFDPFGGSGTVGRMAMQMERYFFMTEQEKEYIERARELLGGQKLFNSYAPSVHSYKLFCELMSHGEDK